MATLAEQLQTDVTLLHSITHGPASGAGSTVATEGGNVSTIAKVVADANAAIQAILGGAVTSVAGRTGAVTLTQADIAGLTVASTPQFAKLLIGTATLGATRVRMGGPATGGATLYAMYAADDIQSDVTGSYSSFVSTPSTAAAAFTIPTLIHFAAAQGAIGSGSGVTSQIGFYVNSTLTGATNNFAFRSTLPAAAGRWNLYMDGTAANYLAGTLSVGTAGVGRKLTVSGNGIQVIGTTGTVGALVAEGTTISLQADSAAATRFLIDAGASNAAGQVSLNGGSSGNVQFALGGTEKMRLDGTGLGVGTTSPAASLQVGITGSVWNGGAGRVGIVAGANAAGGTLAVVSTTPLAANNGGSVSFGGLYDSNSVDFAQVVGAKENATSGNTAGYFRIRTRPNAGNMTDQVTVTSTGKVGIGNFAPSGVLDVAKPSGGRFQVVDEGANTYNVIASRNAADSAVLPLTIRGNGFTFEPGTGNVTIDANSNFATSGRHVGTYAAFTGPLAAYTSASGAIYMGYSGGAFFRSVSDNAATAAPIDFQVGNGVSAIYVSAARAVRFAGYGAGTLVTDSSGNITASSDRRLKNVSGKFTRGLEAVKGIQPKVFTWKPESGMNPDDENVGFIAQDVLADIPEAVGLVRTVEVEEIDEATGEPVRSKRRQTAEFMTLNDRPILAAVVNAVKELAARLEAVEAR